MPNPRPTANRSAEEPLMKYNIRRKSRFGCLRKCIIATAVIATILVVAFIIIFVGIPLGFKYSPNIQRSFVFPISELEPQNPEFTNFAKYQIEGVRNFQVLVNKGENVSLGVWHVLPETIINSSIQNSDFNYSESLAQSEYPVIVHFHGNGGNRIDYIDMYLVLRTMFHVIAFDYRCYGDSSVGTLTEDAIVEDSVQLYKWLRNQTSADIYFWGHSLGSALCTSTAAKLRIENIFPAGLFLESPFSTMKDEVQHVLTMMWFTKLFSWLPWYECTVVNAFEDNGFCFKTTEHILMVDCPIMILHAEDDSIIPFTQGQKLFKIAQERRNPTVQGNVVLHLFPAYRGFDHFRIYNASELPNYIKNHIEICKEYKERNNSVVHP